MNHKSIFSYRSRISGFCAFCAFCGSVILCVALPAVATQASDDVYPVSDPDNRGDWHYNSVVSDEFNTPQD